MGINSSSWKKILQSPWTTYATYVSNSTYIYGQSVYFLDVQHRVRGYVVGRVRANYKIKKIR